MTRGRSLQVWAETLSPEKLSVERTLTLLQKFNVQLNVALFPHQLDSSLEKMLNLYAEKGIAVELWLLLPREKGYWPNERNASLFLPYLEKTLEWLQKRKLSASAICVDLEPPIQQAEALTKHQGIAFYTTLLRILKQNRHPTRLQKGREAFQKAVQRIHQAGLNAQVAVFPYIVEDFVTGKALFQDLTESPVQGPNWDSYTFMFYTTLLAEDTPFFTRRDARAHLYLALQDAFRSLGEKAEVCVGLTGSAQILRPEPTYAHPSELAADIAAGAEAGIQTFAIYNLEGILAYPHPEIWFRYAKRVQPKAPPLTLKAKLWRRLLQAFARKHG